MFYLPLIEVLLPQGEKGLGIPRTSCLIMGSHSNGEKGLCFVISNYCEKMGTHPQDRI